MISWQYLAGMVDADGSIGTTRTGKNRNVVGRVIIVNTNHAFLQLLKSQYGGSLNLRKKGSKEGWKPFGSISWTNRQAEYILENILPFLIIKKEQATLCLELIKLRDLSKSERFDYIKVPVTGLKERVVGVLKSNIRDREEEIGSLIKSLNKKGVPIDAT